MRRLRLAAMLGSVFLVSSCCARDVTLNEPVVYRLPLGKDAAPGAEQCFDACLPRYAESPAALTACVAKCPGLVVRRQRGCGAQDVPPRAACWSSARRVQRRTWDATAGPAGAVTGAVVGATVGALLGLGLAFRAAQEARGPGESSP